ncbi:hypothetical protein QUF51_03615 [Bacillus pumilus]|nr:hypothetical protein [Bacillus pumilus]OLP64227.1 hypothetical protein BACPU_27070 [Bacillus pumilus]
MQNHVEKELFRLSLKYAFIGLYSFMFPFIIQLQIEPSLLFIAITALIIFHHLLESVFWLYKSRNIRKRQTGDLSKTGHVFVRIVQRLEQLFMICFVIYFMTEVVKGGADVFLLTLSAILFIVVFLHHLQFFYIQIFFQSKSGFGYTLSLKRSRPSWIVRERKAMGRSL